MPKTSFTIRGDKQVRIGLEKLGRGLKGFGKRKLRQALDRGIPEASGYWSGGGNYEVPPRPGQDYVRTGDYGQGFGVTNREDGYVMNRKSKHSVYVGGDGRGEGQAIIHRGRWPNVYETMRRVLLGVVDQTKRTLRGRNTLRDVLREFGIGM